MKYCHNCGAKIEEGDVFCINCGAKQFIDSPAEEKQFQQNVNHDDYDNLNTQRVQQAVRSYPNFKNQIDFANGGDILLKMLLKPVTGAKEFVEKGEKGTAIGITILLVVMQGILGVWKVNQFLSGLQKLAVDFVQRMTTFANLINPSSSSNPLGSSDILDITNQINRVKSLINIPYSKIFLQNSVLIIILTIILFIILFLGTNILSKNKNDTFAIYKAAIITLVPTLYFELFSIIFSYLSFYIGFGVAVIGVIISLVCLAAVIKDNLNIDENYSAFIVAVSFVVILVGLSISLQSFISSNISDIVMSVSNAIKTLRE